MVGPPEVRTHRSQQYSTDKTEIAQTKIKTSVYTDLGDDFTELNLVRTNKETAQRTAASPPRMLAGRGSGERSRIPMPKYAATMHITIWIGTLLIIDPFHSLAAYVCNLLAKSTHRPWRAQYADPLNDVRSPSSPSHWRVRPSQDTRLPIQVLYVMHRSTETQGIFCIVKLLQRIDPRQSTEGLLLSGVSL